MRYLGAQWSERDGDRRRVVPGIFGIFGHGNVCGLGPALEEDEGRALRFHQPKNEQSMVHAAIGYARASNLLSTLACTASIGPGSTNLAHRRGDRDGQPRPGAAAALRHLREPPPGSGDAGARAPARGAT